MKATTTATAIRVDGYTKAVLTTIAILLALIALRPAGDLPSVRAQSDYSYLHVEPGTTILRNLDGRGEVQGKVVIDRRNGDIWGFPTRTSAHYPVVVTSSQAPISVPMYLGKFDFSAMKRVP